MFDGPDNVLNLWVDKTNSYELENMLEYYDKNAVLLPTFSNKICHGLNDIKSYFKKVFAHKKLLVTIHDKTLITQDLSNDVFSLSGIYLWQFEVNDEKLNFEARFTFLIDINRLRPILHHHSSQIPRGI